MRRPLASVARSRRAYVRDGYGEQVGSSSGMIERGVEGRSGAKRASGKFAVRVPVATARERLS